MAATTCTRCGRAPCRCSPAPIDFGTGVGVDSDKTVAVPVPELLKLAGVAAAPSAAPAVDQDAVTRVVARDDAIAAVNAVRALREEKKEDTAPNAPPPEKRDRTQPQGDPPDPFTGDSERVTVDWLGRASTGEFRLDALLGGQAADALVLGDPFDVSSTFEIEVAVDDGAPVVRQVHIGADLDKCLSPAIVLTRTDVIVDVNTLSPFERFVLGRVDGKKTVQMIQDEMRLSESDLRIALALLVEKQLIAVPDAPPPAAALPRVPSKPPTRGAQSHVDAAFERAVDALLDVPVAAPPLVPLELIGLSPIEPAFAVDTLPVIVERPSLATGTQEQQTPAAPQSSAPPTPPPGSMPAPASPPAFAPAFGTRPAFAAAGPAFAAAFPAAARPAFAPPPSTPPAFAPSTTPAFAPPPSTTPAFAPPPKKSASAVRGAAAAKNLDVGRPAIGQGFVLGNARAQSAALFDRAVREVKNGAYDRARALVAQAAQLVPEDESYKAALADWPAFVASHKTPEDQRAVAQAIRAEECGDLARATQLLRQATHINPHNASAWNRLGLVLARQKDMKGATEAMAKAMELAPDDAAIVSNFAKIAGAAEKSGGLDRRLRALWQKLVK